LRALLTPYASAPVFNGDPAKVKSQTGFTAVFRSSAQKREKFRRLPSAKSRTFIVHKRSQESALVHDANGDSRTRRTQPQGILHQVGKYPAQTGLVTGNFPAGRRICLANQFNSRSFFRKSG
jgi:hypothetical protein